MLSLIVPTRRRVPSLLRFLDSLHATAADPSSFEVVLVIDDDDPASRIHHTLALRHAVGPPGRTMAELNLAGFTASRGEHVMLLNDDVIAHTSGWDRVLLHHARRFDDGIVLVHANDGLMRHHLCVFPLLSRRYVARVGLCDPRYRRYRIDDHIEDVFLRLAALGERRIVYLPDVVFEHLNAVRVNGRQEYHAPPDVLAPDAALFDSLADERQLAAVRLYASIIQRRFIRRSDTISGPAQYDRAPGVSVLPPAGPAALNRQIAAAEHDFIVIADAPPADLLAPREEALIHRRGAIYLDRARVGHTPFNERYRGFLFDIDLALRHGVAFAPGPQPWGTPSGEDYVHDLELFRQTYTVDPGVPLLPRVPSLLMRAMRCWRERGLAGVVTAALAAIGRPAAASEQRSSPR